VEIPGHGGPNGSAATNSFGGPVVWSELGRPTRPLSGGAVPSSRSQTLARALLAATIVIATIVVVINRLLWRRLYALAENRYKLES